MIVLQIQLKAARVNAGFTQKQAAKMLNLSKNTLSSYEAYKTKPDIETAIKIAELYKISINDIIFFAQ